MAEVQRVRDLEKAAKAELKHVNNVVQLLEFVSDCQTSNEVRMAAIHSLRRVFLCYSEQGWIHKGKTSDGKGKEYLLWFHSQYQAFKDELSRLIAGEDETFHAVSIRTILELMKIDEDVLRNNKIIQGRLGFCKATYRSLLTALVVRKSEIDVDLLLMLKEELFCFNDCLFYGFEILHELVASVKELRQLEQNEGDNIETIAKKTSLDLDIVTKNIIDLCRILSLPEELDEEDEDSFLVSLISKKPFDDLEDDNREESDDGDAENDSDSEDGSDEDENGRPQDAAAPIKTLINPLLAELAGLNTIGKRKRSTKRESKDISNKKMKRIKRAKKRLPVREKLVDLDSYRKLFSKLWVQLLSLPKFSPAQHKIILKHLPEHVIPHLQQPILLADYLTMSFEMGGVVAVLALESLFDLILNHNLDYPDFFQSLYRLCTVEVFSAKYRNKFIKLLNASLKSVNLPAYLVAAFIKRLSGLAFRTPSSNSKFLIAQCIWLLRQHPQTQALIHRAATAQIEKEFNNDEEKDLEKCNALHSSLWEIELLQNHHLYGAAKLAKHLLVHESTMTGPAAVNAYIHVEDFFDVGYNELLDVEYPSQQQKKKKCSAAMSYRKPEQLFSEKSIIGRSFGV